MPTLDQIRAKIVTNMQTVANIGNVYDYERYAVQQGAFRALYLFDLGGGEKQIRGWHVRRFSTKESSATKGRNIVTHGWRIRGYMALDDDLATEKTFDDLVEAVRDVFRADETLGSLVASTVPDGGIEAGMQVEECLPVMLAGVLCHSTRIKLNTVHYL